MSLEVFQLTQMLNTKGQTTAYTKTSEGTYDPRTGVNTTTETIYTIKAYFASFKLQQEESTVGGSRKVFLSTVDISEETIPEIAIGDKLEVLDSQVALVAPSGAFWVDLEGNSYTTTYNVTDKAIVKDVQKIYSGNNVILYLAEVSE